MKKKFNYYIYYKNPYFYLENRNNHNIVSRFVTFYSLYCYIKNQCIDYNDVKLRSTTLYDLKQNFISFGDDEDTRI